MCYMSLSDYLYGFEFYQKEKEKKKNLSNIKRKMKPLSSGELFPTLFWDQAFSLVREAPCSL